MIPLAVVVATIDRELAGWNRRPSAYPLRGSGAGIRESVQRGHVLAATRRVALMRLCDDRSDRIRYPLTVIWSPDVSALCVHIARRRERVTCCRAGLLRESRHCAGSGDTPIPIANKDRRPRPSIVRTAAGPAQVRDRVHFV